MRPKINPHETVLKKNKAKGLQIAVRDIKAQVKCNLLAKYLFLVSTYLYLYLGTLDTSTHIQFRMVVSDTIKLDERTSCSLFKDSEEHSGEGAIDLAEQEMMRWLFNNQDAIRILCDELDIPNGYMWGLEIKDPIIKYATKKPGDIDAILCHNSDPRKSIAFESKKVKIRFTETKESIINKVESLRKGVEQVNALSKLGFYKCYLLVMIVTDGGNLQGEDQIFKRASNKDLDRIYNFDGYRNLESNIGIILCLITQLSGKSLNMNNAVAIREHKKAIPQEQPGNLNDDIIAYIKRVANK